MPKKNLLKFKREGFSIGTEQKKIWRIKLDHIYETTLLGFSLQETTDENLIETNGWDVIPKKRKRTISGKYIYFEELKNVEIYNKKIPKINLYIFSLLSQLTVTVAALSGP